MKSLILFLSVSLISVFGFAQDCASVNITGGSGQINISGLTGAPIIGVQVFNSGWASVFNQTYTNQPGNVSVPLSAGLYHVNVRFYNSSWGSICEKTADATVTSGTPQPADSCNGTFQKTAGLLAGNDEAFNIVKASDGNFIAVGQASASGTTNHDGLLMKLDSKGSVVWSKTIGGAQHDFFTQIVATADGGGLAAGRTNSGGIGTYTGDVWFVRFDGTGNVVWQKRYFVAGNPGEVYTLISTSDGGFAFSGTFPFIAGPADWMVVKMDANGNIQWQKKLATNNSDNSVGLIEDDHGGPGYIVSGNIYRTGILPDAVITKLDLSGNVVWTKGYDFDSRSNWIGLPITKVADGLIYYGRNDAGFDHEDAKLAILKTDFSGNIIWNKEFTMTNCRDGKLLVLPDGSFMWSQSPVPFDANSDVHLARISATGNVMWGKKYPRAGAQFLHGLVADGDYVFGVGLATSGSYSDVLLGKTDLNGKMGTCTSQNVAVVTRNVVATDLNFTWPTTANLNLSTANTTYSAASMTPVENVLCSDGCPTVTVGNATVSENAGNAVVQVCIASPAATSLVYNYTTANGSATSGSDYTGGSGTVTILAGQTCGTISIPITNDTEIESPENFIVSIGSATGTVTINDDDQPGGNCSGVTFTPGNNQITVSGVTAALATIQVFNSSWATVFNQSYTNSPGTVVVPIAPGAYLVKVTFYTSGWGYICDKSDNVTVVNNCPAGTICISNICPSQTVNLNDAYSIPNLPAGTTVSWHTGTPATDANKMTDQEAQNVSVSGTYYAAINISGAGCYSATIPVNVTIVACSGAAVTSSSTLVEKGNIVQLKSNDQPAVRSIMAFPNPFTRSLRVVIDSEIQERATLTLTDLQGRQLKQIPVQLMPGSNTISLDGLDRFPSGSYFLKINSDKGMKTLKVIRQQ